MNSPPTVARRMFLKTAMAGALIPFDFTLARAQQPPTKFQIACMTLPYNQYSLQRALEGIKSAGFEYVAWGTTHREAGDSKPVPVIPADAPPTKAKELADRCRGMGLAPVLMFSGIYPEAPNGVEVLTNRLKQAAAAKIPHVLTFGHTDGQNRKLWVERFK